MRLETPTLGLLVNFLIGTAWAFVLVGIIYTFFSFYNVSLVDAIMLSFLGALPGIFLVVILEYFIVGLQRLEEMKKQTKLLEKLLMQGQIQVETTAVE
ncbi:MAG: hypothetical protein U9R27_10910 [Campylobacterota bacterium]|nr:hypothetical protein [Campylobacterota bacterium]